MLKKQSNLSYNDVREKYEHFRSRCTEEKPRIFNFKKSAATGTGAATLGFIRRRKADILG
jgi:hypothetical protein